MNSFLYKVSCLGLVLLLGTLLTLKGFVGQKVAGNPPYAASNSSTDANASWQESAADSGVGPFSKSRTGTKPVKGTITVKGSGNFTGNFTGNFLGNFAGKVDPQERYYRRDRFSNRGSIDADDIRFEGYDRRGIPNWKTNPNFRYDEFRFVRVKYNSYGRTRWGQKWRIDYPDSDLNFSFRLQQLTSLKVNPHPIYLELTDERIFDYPFMYLIEPGDIAFSMEEAKAMRRYLNNGGFIMVDDFWGDQEWWDFEDAMKMVFPNKTYEELSLDHPIFHCVYDLKKKPQCPAIGLYERYGETTDRPWDPSARDVHYRAYYDDNNRMCMIACFNTDLGDGWEREGESEFYFKRFSEKEAYPMGINIVVYAMTH